VYYLLAGSGGTVVLARGQGPRSRTLPQNDKKSDTLDSVLVGQINEKGDAAPLVRAPGADSGSCATKPGWGRFDPGRSRHCRAVEKLLEDALLIQVSRVAVDLEHPSGAGTMLEAVIAR